eukprot:c12094_g1_i2 orf=46-216(+)
MDILRSKRAFATSTHMVCLDSAFVLQMHHILLCSAFGYISVDCPTLDISQMLSTWI